MGNITITLAAETQYTVSAPIVAPANVVINGNGATIDASELTGNFIEMAVVEAPTEWTEANVTVKELTVKGLKKALFYSACKNYFGDVTVDKCVVEQAADATTFDYTKGSTAVNFTVTNSTFYAPTATTMSFYSSQSGQKTTEYNNEAVQTFTFTNNTMYNLAPSKNFFSHRQNSQKWLTYDVKNNIFVNCGKSGQVIKGMNGGGSSANPVWDIDGNVFNFDGADTSAAESTGDEAEPVKNSIAGIVTFTDAANGDFNGVLALAPGTEAPAAMPGDARWTVTAATGYTVKAENCEGMTITPEVAYAAEGTKVYATYTLAEGYQLDKPEFVDDNGDAIEFAEGQIGLDDEAKKMWLIMPAKNVTIKAKASKLSKITLALSQENGQATCISVNKDDESTFNKKAGEEIYLNIVPAEGYEAEISVMAGETAVEVTAEAGEYKGQAYTHKFIMPAADVTVTVTFKSATGINSIAADALKDATIFTIGGQRVDKAQKGLYIINGKKVVIK